MNMKFIKKILLLLGLSLVGCKTSDKVIIRVVQLPFISFAYDGEELIGYYFKNEELAVSSYLFNKGQEITEKDIEYMQQNSNSTVYPLTNEIGVSLTDYVINFDKKTGMGTIFFEPSVINHDLTLYFGIYK